MWVQMKDLSSIFSGGGKVSFPYLWETPPLLKAGQSSSYFLLPMGIPSPDQLCLQNDQLQFFIGLSYSSVCFVGFFLLVPSLPAFR